MCTTCPNLPKIQVKIPQISWPFFWPYNTPSWSIASPILVQTPCIMAWIEAINTLKLLIYFSSTCQPANQPASPKNGSKALPAKVLCIESMLLETDDLYRISDALDVSYDSMAYHKRRLALLPTSVTYKVACGLKRAFGANIEDVSTWNPALWQSNLLIIV